VGREEISWSCRMGSLRVERIVLVIWSIWSWSVGDEGGGG
jgi:hypothetical protein